MVRMRWRIPRWLARAPIPLLRHGYGWLLGSRFLLLEHIGRRSGLPRYVALEVISAERGEWYVVSAYGERAQWFRNIVRQPRVRVWWLRLREVPCQATVLDRIAAREVYTSYVNRNPRLARALARWTTGAPQRLDRGELVEHFIRDVPLVCLSSERRAA